MGEVGDGKGEMEDGMGRRWDGKEIWQIGVWHRVGLHGDAALVSWMYQPPTRGTRRRKGRGETGKKSVQVHALHSS
jgi:hypothetical protein